MFQNIHNLLSFYHRTLKHQFQFIPLTTSAIVGILITMFLFSVPTLPPTDFNNSAIYPDKVLCTNAVALFDQPPSNCRYVWYLNAWFPFHQGSACSSSLCFTNSQYLGATIFSIYNSLPGYFFSLLRERLGLWMASSLEWISRFLRH